MKRITVLTLTLLIMLMGSLTTAPTAVADDLQSSKYQNTKLGDLGLDQEEEFTDSYYPIFDSVSSTGSVTEVRPRNETNGEGAIVQVQERSNVTFRYAVALQNTSSFIDDVDFRLFGDLPLVNTTNFNNTDVHVDLSLTDSSSTITLEYTNTNSTGNLNYTHPFTDEILPNATLYWYETTLDLNVSSSFIPFYVADVNTGGLGEAQNDGPYNLLTIQQYFDSESQDEFYVQNELVNITGNYYDAKDYAGTEENDTLGISYQINSGVEQSENFTLVYSGNQASDTITLNDYNPGTVISWTIDFYATNDTLINSSRIISNIDSKSVEVGDGTPELEITVDPNNELGLFLDNVVYSINFSLTFYVTATVPKGNITTLDLYATNETASPSAFDPIDGSLGGVTLNQTFDYTDLASSSDGDRFNATIAAETDKGLNVEKSVSVVIDTVNPQILSLATAGGNDLTTSDGRVTFNFGYSDDNSGVKRAILDLGNGEAVEVTDRETLTYRYNQFSDVSYEYTLTVVDYAGNSVEMSGTLTLSSSSVDTDRASPFGIIVFFVVLIALITSPWWGPKAVDMIRNR